MRRDFSEAARQEMFTLVKQVENGELEDFTDWVGDRWCDFEDYIGKLDLKKYIDQVNEYHKKVIAKNQEEVADIQGVFDAMDVCSENYRGRFLALLTNLQTYRKSLDLVADVIVPGNGNFNPTYIGSGLKGALNVYLENRELLQEMSGDGLSAEKLVEGNNQAQIINLLDEVCNTAVALMPNLKLGQKVEVPMGPNLKAYYAVEGKVDGNGNVDVSAVIKDQKVKLSSISLKTDGDLKMSLSHSADGGNSISVGSGGANLDINLNNAELGGSGSIVVGDNTYTTSMKASMEGLQMEKSVTTKLEGGSITSKIGIIKSKEENSQWAPVRVPVPVDQVPLDQIPELNADPESNSNWETIPPPSYTPDPVFSQQPSIDWETVTGVAIAAWSIYTIVYCGAAILTEGASMAFLPPPLPFLQLLTPLFA